MKSIKQAAVYGMGAVGAAYAFSLHEYLGKEKVAVLCRGERKERYEKNPFTVNGKTVSFTLTEPEKANNPYDLILVGVKYGELPEAIADIAPCVGENTVILSLLNGIDTEEGLQAAYGAEKVPRCFVVGIDTLRVGTTVNTNYPGRIVFGFDDPSLKERLAPVGELLQAAGIGYEISDKMKREQWWKFMLNAAMNQLSAVLNLPYAAFQEDPHVRQMCRLVCEEVIAVANAEGIPMGEPDIERFFKVAVDLSATGITSMCADVRNKRKTEVEMLAGVINRLGERHKVPTPYNTALYHMIRYIETHY